jgi:hypothetical protein
VAKVKKIKMIAEFTYEPHKEDYPGCETIEDMLKMDSECEGIIDVMMDAIGNGNAPVRLEVVEE